jgi:hypothetical protein
MHFSLKMLLIAIAFVAVSLGALLNANDLWRIGFRSAVLVTVLIAATGAVCSSGKTRAFCIGYVLFSLSFFTKFFSFAWGSELITTNALSTLHAQMFAPQTERVSGPISSEGWDLLDISAQVDGTSIISFIRPRRDQFVAVGHAVLSIPLGIIGGVIAMAFHRRSRNERDFLKEAKQ